jgi:undecaprenyl-diphosphatase
MTLMTPMTLMTLMTLGTMRNAVTRVRLLVMLVGNNRSIMGDHVNGPWLNLFGWAATVVLALRRQWRLAIYLLVTGAGALILDPVLKSLVGRLRPVLAHPIAHGTGDSFPSGHSLGSIVCYGAILLVFLPAARGRWRPAFITVIVALIALIGISRILLGVHYLSDVVGAWAIGITWLGVTAFAFELARSAAGRPVTDPVSEGLEPEARADLKPAQPEPSSGSPVGQYGRTAAAVVVAWVLSRSASVPWSERCSSSITSSSKVSSLNARGDCSR